MRGAKGGAKINLEMARDLDNADLVKGGEMLFSILTGKDITVAVEDLEEIGLTALTLSFMKEKLFTSKFYKRGIVEAMISIPCASIILVTDKKSRKNASKAHLEYAEHHASLITEMAQGTRFILNLDDSIDNLQESLVAFIESSYDFWERQLKEMK